MKEERRRAWNISILEKLTIAFFYAKQMALNPAYLNSSIFDSISAYISSYFLEHDYLQLFDYVPWDEQTVNTTLIKEFEFEVLEDSPTTWRIGDGTVPFYNYIYLALAGFSEFDTFRSNQIRDGKLDRNEALKKLALENKPRFDAIKEYCCTVGVSFDKTIKIINAFADTRNDLK